MRRHFFLVEEGGEWPRDAGQNPLALYPFWTDWHDCPGATTPRMDPAGHLWISALGPYAENQKWLVRHKPAW